MDSMVLVTACSFLSSEASSAPAEEDAAEEEALPPPPPPAAIFLPCSLRRGRADGGGAHGLHSPAGPRPPPAVTAPPRRAAPAPGGGEEKQAGGEGGCGERGGPCRPHTERRPRSEVGSAAARGRLRFAPPGRRMRCGGGAVTRRPPPRAAPAPPPPFCARLPHTASAAPPHRRFCAAHAPPPALPGNAHAPPHPAVLPPLRACALSGAPLSAALCSRPAPRPTWRPPALWRALKERGRSARPDPTELRRRLTAAELPFPGCPTLRSSFG